VKVLLATATRTQFIYTPSQTLDWNSRSDLEIYCPVVTKEIVHIR